MTRTLDAWCPDCSEVRRHIVLDPGSCQCPVCGHVEVLTRPLNPGEEGIGDIPEREAKAKLDASSRRRAGPPA